MKSKFEIGLVSLKQGDGYQVVGIAYIGTYLKKHLGNNIELKIID